MNLYNSSDAPETEAPAPSEVTSNSVSSSYEAPAIETVFSPDDLQREVLYAGGDPVSDGGVPGFPI